MGLSKKPDSGQVGRHAGQAHAWMVCEDVRKEGAEVDVRGGVRGTLISLAPAW